MIISALSFLSLVLFNHWDYSVREKNDPIGAAPSLLIESATE